MRALALCVLTLAAAAAPGRAADVSEYRVPVALKRDLQALLDEHGAIRLDANVDYRARKSDVLTLSSGQRIVGGWNTRVPRIVIPGGVSNVRVENVRSDGTLAPDVEFTGGAPNDDVTIVGGNGGAGTQIRVRIDDGARINRLSLTEFGGLDVRQRTSGFVRDSTFTGMLGYWPGPQVAWQGNSREPSRNNAFLGLVSLTPGAGSFWKNPGDLLLAGWDCESWNGPGDGGPRCFSIDGATRVVSASLGGGTVYPQHGGALLGLAHVPAFVSWFQHGRGGQLDNAEVVLDDVGTVLQVQPETDMRIRDDRAPSNAARLGLFEPLAARGGARVGHKSAPAAATDEQRSALLAAARGPWLAPAAAKPVLRALNDPLGARWRDGLAAQPDSAPRIQADVDDDGIATLAPGVYYLSAPLRVGRRGRVEGVIGAGRGDVVLVAKGDFPVIAGRGNVNDLGEVNLVLSGFTLYGGTYGIHWSREPDNFGPATTIAWSQFDDLRFMKQSRAGVNVAGIHGLDSNLWHRVDFADMPVAIRGDGTGSGPGMSYADKQHFVDCQYRRIADAVWYWTSDRASGGEIFKDNVYSDVGSLTRTRGANNLLWVNSVMENVTGNVAIDIVDAGTTVSYYFVMVDSLWRGRGPAVVTDTQSWQVGTLFIDTEFAQTGGSIVAAAPEQSLFALGSRITGSAAVGSVQSGMFVDSRMGRFVEPLQIVDDGAVVTLAPGAPSR